jgi:hypothetical protein
VTASLRVIDAFRRSGRNVLRVLGASGQLGYGVPTPAFQAGLAREPDIIGCDMGSIDIGPYYLGAGQMATAPAATRRDLRKVILAARQHDIPLVIGSAGSAGAGPHLDATLAIVRDIAREDGLHFRLGVLRADMPRDLLHKAVHAGEVHGIDGMPPLTLEEVDAASQIVGQMGSSAFQRGLAAGVDVLIAGRACDTGIFASLPIMLGLPAGLAMHMAKIVECASICCVPGGRDSILATLDAGGFELESMALQRCATPVSVVPITISGVRAGANRPIQTSVSASGRPASRTVDTSGNSGDRSGEVIDRPRTTPDWMCGSATTIGANIMSTRPASTSVMACDVPR